MSVEVEVGESRRRAVVKTITVSKQADIADLSKTNDTLYNILRPALTVLRVFGLIHNVDWVRARDESKSPWTLSKAYNIAVLVILWNSPLRLVTLYEASDFSGIQASAFMKLLTHVWMLLCALNGTVMFYAFHNKDMMKKLFALYEHVSCHYDCGSAQKLRRRMRIILAVTLTVFVVFTVSYLVAFFAGVPQLFALFKNALAPFHKAEWIKSSVPMKLVFFVFFVFDTASNCFTMMLFFILCFLIIGMERSFTAYVEQRVRNEDGTLDCDLFRLRMHFLRICDIIEAANDVFQNYIGFNLILYVANTGLVIWTLISSNSFATDIFAAVYMLYWLLTTVIQLLILSYGAGMINDKAYDFVHVIYRLRSVNIAKGEDVQVSLLLAKLDGPKIGFSAFDLFMVDKPSIMAVFGMILSFLLLMVDMGGNASSSSTCDQVSLNATASTATSS